MLEEPTANNSKFLNAYSTINFSLAGLLSVFLFDKGLSKAFLDVSKVGIDRSIIVSTLIVLIIGTVLTLIYWLFSSIFEIWTNREFTIPLKYKVALSVVSIPLPVLIYKPCLVLIKKIINKLNL